MLNVRISFLSTDVRDLKMKSNNMSLSGYLLGAFGKNAKMFLLCAKLFVCTMWIV